MKPHEGELREGAGGPFGGHTLFNTATPGGQGCPSGEKKKRVVTPTETNVHGEALCFMVKTWARHMTTETLLNNGWQLEVGGGWRLTVGGWRLVVAGG